MVEGPIGQFYLPAKIAKSVENLKRILLSPEAFEGETFAFNFEVTKGIFNKSGTCAPRVSNYRFFEFSFEKGTMNRGPFPIQNVKAVVGTKHSEGSGFGLRTYMGSQSVGTWNRESSIVGEVSVFWIPTGQEIYHIRMGDPQGFANIVNNLRELYLKAHAPNPTEKPQVQGNLGTQLEKLAQLLKDGVMTQTDFDLGKKKLSGVGL